MARHRIGDERPESQGLITRIRTSEVRYRTSSVNGWRRCSETTSWRYKLASFTSQCCSPLWTDLEQRVMQGALIAQNETGAALNVHHVVSSRITWPHPRISKIFQPCYDKLGYAMKTKLEREQFDKDGGNSITAR